MSVSTALVWFRRDLRAHDHAALSMALRNHARVFCVFVFDTDMLGRLSDKQDRRVEFIWHSVKALRETLIQMGGGLMVQPGRARVVIPGLAHELGAEAVYANRDYEPEAVARDADVAAALKTAGTAFHLFKDQVIFERDDVLSGSGRPYSVFAPYKQAWLKRIQDADLQPYPIAEHVKSLARPPADALPKLETLGFRRTDLLNLGVKPGIDGAAEQWQQFREHVADYDALRDLPARDATSRLGVHLRFGTLSIRELARHAYYAKGKGAQTWLSELIWREFFQMILHHHPRVVNSAFRADYTGIAWPGKEADFRAWCEGCTGYPIVDAAMRQLNQTGFMHNRLRMIVASFLVKDLLVDWLKGERYFATKLLDYDLAANNGNWQWAASTGCDAQPYFRIFNPVTQSQRFDPEGKFIRQYVPELAHLEARDIHAPWLLTPIEQAAYGIHIGRDYPEPIVKHDGARQRAIALFKSARK